MPSNFKFPILDSAGSPTAVTADFDDMFASKDAFLMGNLYGWGFNTYGAVGNDTNTTHVSSPAQLGPLNNWRMVTGGGNALAIRADGTLWAWGGNLNGETGNGTVNIYYSSPVQVGSLTTWKNVFYGASTVHAIKRDGTLWAWGLGSNGRLGLNNISSYSSPVQVGALTNWKQIYGYDAVFAIKTDGTLWTWGLNTNGRLGNNGSANVSSPVQIGTLTDWKVVAVSYYATAAIRGDGSLWTWGNGTLGQLGDGTSVDRSSPVQVGSLTDWRYVVGCPGASSGIRCFHAIKTDGTLWAWGENLSGVYGNGTVNTSSTPIQIGALTNWKMLSRGSTGGVLAIKTDGTLWGWGPNSYGQLGNGTTNQFSSPVQIGSMTNWKMIDAGGSTPHGITSNDLP